MPTEEGYKKFVREQKILEAKQLVKRYAKGGGKVSKKVLVETGKSFKAVPEGLGILYEVGGGIIRGKKMPKKYAGKKVSSKLRETFMGVLKKIQKERDLAMSSQIAERKRWISEMNKRKAIVRAQQQEAAEMVAAQQRAEYTQSDGFLEGRDEVFEMQRLQAEQQPTQQQEQYDNYGRPLGNITKSGLRAVGRAGGNILHAFTRYKGRQAGQRVPLRQSGQREIVTNHKVNRWNNQNTNNILNKSQRNLLTPIGQRKVQSPFVHTPNSPLNNPPRLQFWNA